MADAIPLLSVVLAVFNGEDHLEESLESVLSQRGVDLEVLAVDDGSTDGTREILERHARADRRLRVLRQANEGLTRSLIRGCGEARGRLIARQDADDISLPGRFAAQCKLLQSQTSAKLVGCWTRFIGPEGEDIGTWEPPSDPATATRALRSPDIKEIRALGGHGSAMFRREDYRLSGGYRAPFYYAQDIDLWLRLTDTGSLALVPEILYCWRFSPSSITGRSRDAQVKTAELILEAARRRQRGETEEAILETAATIRPDPGSDAGNRRSREGASLYFIGKRLLDKGDARSVAYLKRAAKVRPFHLRTWVALALAYTRLGGNKPS